MKTCLFFASDSPEVKQIDMLHALPYGQMDLTLLKQSMETSKKFDKELENTMMLEKFSIIVGFINVK